MKKRFIAVVLALILVLSLAACKTGGKDDKFVIYLITMDTMDGHWKTVDEGCKAAVAEIGADKIEYHWDAPPTKDDNAQIEKINNAVAAGANLILLAANGPDAVTAAIKEADTAGVKFLYVDSPANWDGALQTIATDNKAAGKTAGVQLLDALTAAGVTEGKIGIVNVKPDTTSCVLREEGFREAFASTAFELLPTQFGEGDPAKSKDIADAYIADGVVGMFGTNEGGTVGVGNALKENANSGIIGVGFDTGASVPELVNEGVLLCVMAQDPYNMGYLGIKNAYDYLANGKTPSPAFYDSGAVVKKKGDF